MDDKQSHTENFLESKLLYPEVLEESDLLQMLKERHIPVDMKELGDKVSLISLCHKNIVPRPQRIYRSNRRGQMMTQQQVKLYGERPSNLTVLDKNNFTISTGDRLKPPPSTDGKLKLLTDGVRIKLPQSMDRLKLSPSGDRLKPPPCSERLKPSPTGDRIKPAPCSERLKPSPTGDRIKPPLPVISSGQTENKAIIRLSDHSTCATADTVTNQPSNKRSAAAAAGAEDSSSPPPSKRIHLGSSTTSLNQEVRTNRFHEQSKDLLNNSAKLEDGPSKKFTRISWP